MSGRDDMELATEESLTFGDRINYAFVVGRAILKFIEVVTSQEYSREQIEDSAYVLRALIPEGLADEEFKGDLKAAEYQEMGKWG